MRLVCVEETEELVQVKTVGQIAPSSADQLRDPFLELFGPQIFHRSVELDLSESDFISSSGIGWLLQANKRFEQHGGKLTLHSIPKAIEQVLRIMRLQSVLHGV